MSIHGIIAPSCEGVTSPDPSKGFEPTLPGPVPFDRLDRVLRAGRAVPARGDSHGRGSLIEPDEPQQNAPGHGNSPRIAARTPGSRGAGAGRRLVFDGVGPSGPEGQVSSADEMANGLLEFRELRVGSLGSRHDHRLETRLPTRQLLPKDLTKLAPNAIATNGASQLLSDGYTNPLHTRHRQHLQHQQRMGPTLAPAVHALVLLPGAKPMSPLKHGF